MERQWNGFSLRRQFVSEKEKSEPFLPDLDINGTLSGWITLALYQTIHLMICSTLKCPGLPPLQQQHRDDGPRTLPP